MKLVPDERESAWLEVNIETCRLEVGADVGFLQGSHPVQGVPSIQAQQAGAGSLPPGEPAGLEGFTPAGPEYPPGSQIRLSSVTQFPVSVNEFPVSVTDFPARFQHVLSPSVTPIDSKLQGENITSGFKMAPIRSSSP